jgi:adenylosuccinate lyase
MLHDHEVNGANSAMMDDAIERACVLTGDLLTRLHVILAGLELHEARMRANLDVTGGLITSEAVMLALGHAIGRQAAHEVIYEAADATRHGVTFSDALKSDRRVMDHIPPEDLEALLDPRARVGLSAELARDAARRAYDLAQELTQEARPMPR